MSRWPERKIIAFVLFVVLVAAFFWLAFIFGFPPNFLKSTFLSISRPAILLKNKIFQSELEAENLRLKQELAQLKIEKELSGVFFEENKSFKEVLSANLDRQLVVAAILLRPGYGLYNSLLVDAGSDQGVEEGMLVAAFGNVLLGRVTDVMPKLSRVRLVSYPDEETNIFISDQQTATAVGVGSENLEIILPYEVEVNVGDKITSLGGSYMLLGVVEKTIKDPADPFQKVIFRLPLNIQELRNVFIVK